MLDLIYLAFCEPLKSCFSVTDFCHPRFAGRSGLWRCMILDRYTTKLEWKLNCTSITETYLRFSYSKWKALSAWQHHYKELCIGYCSLALHKKKAFLKQPWPKYWLKVFVSGIAILMHSLLWIQLYHHLVFLFQGWEHNTWKRQTPKATAQVHWQYPCISSATACTHQKKLQRDPSFSLSFSRLKPYSVLLCFQLPFSPNSKQLLRARGCIASPYFGLSEVQQNSHTCRVAAVISLAYTGCKIDWIHKN